MNLRENWMLGIKSQVWASFGGGSPGEIALFACPLKQQCMQGREPWETQLPSWADILRDHTCHINYLLHFHT